MLTLEWLKSLYANLCYSLYSDMDAKMARQREVDKNQQHILLIAALAGMHPC